MTGKSNNLSAEVLTTAGPHRDRLKHLLEAQDWAGLVRYWIGHHYKRAVNLACLVLGETKDPENLILALNLAVYAPDSTKLGLPPPHVPNKSTPDERLVLRLVELYPYMQQCERAVLGACDQTALLEGGLKASTVAAEIATKLKDEPIQGYVSSIIGSALFNLRRLAEARQYFEQAIKTRRTLYDGAPDVYSQDLALTLNNLGYLLVEMNDLEGAEQSCEEALAIYEKYVGSDVETCRPEIARAHQFLGYIANRRGLHLVCEKHYREAVSRFRTEAARNSIQWMPDLGRSLTCLGAALSELSRTDEAVECHKEAAKIFEPLAAKNEAYRHQLVAIMSNLAAAEQKRDIEPIQQLTESAAHFRALAAGDPMFRHSLAQSLQNLGGAYQNLGQLEPAWRNLHEAALLYDQISAEGTDLYLRERAACLTSLGECYLRQYSTLGWATLKEARATLLKARQYSEKLRSSYTEESQRQRNVAESRLLYDFLFEAHLLIARDFREPEALEAAFETGEARRAQYVMTLLADQAIYSAAPAHLIEELRTVSTHLHDTEIRWLEFNEANSGDVSRRHGTSISESPGPDDLEQTTRELRAQYNSLVKRIGALGDATFDSRPFHSVTVEEFRKHLPPKCAAVHYNINTEHGSALIISQDGISAVDLPIFNLVDAAAWAVKWLKEYLLRGEHYVQGIQDKASTRGYGDKNPHWLEMVEAFKKLVESGMLEQFSTTNDPEGFVKAEAARKERDPEKWYFENFLKVLEKHGGHPLYPNWSTAINGLLEELNQKALTPVLSALPSGVNKLVLVVDQPMQLFPLHACKTPSARPLLELCQVVYTPSAAIFTQKAAVSYSVELRALVISNPTYDLPFSALEGALVSSHYHDAVVLTGYTTTRESIKRNAGSCNVFHYSGHVRFDPLKRLGSSLVLGDLDDRSGWLSVGDLLSSIRLADDCVVIINGCESGFTDATKLQEYLGLTTGFLIAGARCVVTTLWEVRDLPATLLMDHFTYGLRQGAVPAEALQKAQNWLRTGITSGIDLKARVLPALLGRIDEPEYRNLLSIAADKYLQSSPDTPPFASPVYWAPFVITGGGL